MPQTFAILARYNRWANRRLFEDLSSLAPERLAETSAINFGSALGILNHQLLVDRLWLHRFTGQGERLESVSKIVHPDLDGLREARGAEDERIIAWADDLDPASLDRVLHYNSTSGAPCADKKRLLVAHFFNHQTHHRGQVHAMLGMFGLPARDLDLVYYRQEVPQE